MALEKGTLAVGESHPAAMTALAFVVSSPDLMGWQEAFVSLSLSGDRTAEILGETLRRILNNEPVSDRYVLGLAWWMRMAMEYHE